MVDNEKITMQVCTARSLCPPREAATSSPDNSKLERGGIWGEIPTHSGLSVEGRPRGGGDPMVACRGQAGVQDDGSNMICEKVNVKCGGCGKFSTLILKFSQDP